MWTTPIAATDAGPAAHKCAPGFVIAGAQKGGTVFLTRALASHAQLATTVRGGYYLHSAGPERFELAPLVEARDRVLLGHSAAGYMLSPFAAEMARADNPRAMRAIFVLREPVARALSDFRFLFAARTWRVTHTPPAPSAPWTPPLARPRRPPTRRRRRRSTWCR